MNPYLMGGSSITSNLYAVTRTLILNIRLEPIYSGPIIKIDTTMYPTSSKLDT